MEKCDCLNHCGDDPWLKNRRAMPCKQAIDCAHEVALHIQAMMDAQAILENALDQVALAFVQKAFPQLANELP